MSVWSRLFDGLFSGDGSGSSSSVGTSPMVINPATGLPMVGDSYSSVDCGGSPFGADIHSQMPSQSQMAGCGLDNDWMR